MLMQRALSGGRPCGRFVAAMDRSRVLSSAAPDAAAQQSEGVSKETFAQLLHRCGLPNKKLHALYSDKAGRAAPEGEYPVAVALSGGGDSMALTLLLREHLKQRRIQTPLLAITVNHQLRPESGDEAQQIADICTQKWQIKHVTARCEWRDPNKHTSHTDAALAELPVKPRASKVQEEARKYRYELLRRVCEEHKVKRLFVAHNQGDQLETVLFRLGRGSGINGLAGMEKSVTFFSYEHEPSDYDSRSKETDGDDEDDDDDEYSFEDVKLMRPLLPVSKADLKATCRRFKQDWVEDPSNEKLQFDRIRIRKELERLESEQGSDVLDLLWSFQENAAKAKLEFARAERRIFRKYVSRLEPDLVVLRTAFLDDPRMFDELRVRVVSEIVLTIGKKETPPRLSSVTRFISDLNSLANGKSLTLGGCRISLKEKGRKLYFQPERQSKKSV